MAKITQHDRILAYIKCFGSITPMEAFSELGITKLATRISEMRKKGMEFDISTIERKNRFGETVHFAQYKLKEAS